MFSGLNEVLRKRMGKTIILATNQLQFASDCDKIIVMDKGKIVQIGKHKELLKNESGVYYKLYQAQLKKENELVI